MAETLTGPAGTAELVDLDAGTFSGVHTAVASWFLTCPFETPAWKHFALSVIHLRDMPGIPSAELEFPEATHQVILGALNPDLQPTPDIDTWSMLRPINFSGQVQLPDDAAAVRLLQALACARGILWAEPALSGQTEPWASTVNATAAHLRGEH